MHETIYTLVPSTNWGRYALDDPEGKTSLVAIVWPSGLAGSGSRAASNMPESSMPASRADGRRAATPSLPALAGCAACALG